MKNILIGIILFLANPVFAHGEDKYGPHRGFVRMPGAFHTEVVPDTKSNVQIYLLDIDWKNPTTDQSSVVLIFKNKKETKANCVVENNYFNCEFPKTINLYKKGELRLIAERGNQKGQQVIYKLPLKLEKSVPAPAMAPEMKMDHSSHH